MDDYIRQADRSAAMLSGSAAWRRLCELRGDLDDTFASAVLGAAARLAFVELAPLNSQADREGCTLAEGRVRVPDGYARAWRALADGGWLATDLPPEIGGQGLPLALHTACQILFDRACPAFVMAAGATRSGAWLLQHHAEESLREEWAPKLAAGEWTATICISEAEAGSDVARVRTTAMHDGDAWRISGQKMWISFGDHDMAERVGHLILARTAPAETGTRGLSLFLMPSTIDDGAGNWIRNSIDIERIEEKLGLHGSPTCVLRIERAYAFLIGEENAGINQIFSMIELMRLLTAGQGLGIASAASDIATDYAQVRRQGGSAKAKPVAIDTHADVRRQVASLRARTETLRAFILEIAVIMDLARIEPDPTGRAEMVALATWLLPIAKNFGAELGFDISSDAIQILGAAGYTKEWPLEQHLRDSRIFAIFEGTTGMQALDLLHRRLWRDGGDGLTAMIARIRQEIDSGLAPERECCRLQAVLDLYLGLTDEFKNSQANRWQAEMGAEPFLRASWAMVSAWMGLRLCTLADPMLAAAGRYRLAEAEGDMQHAIHYARIPAAMADAFYAPPL